MMALDTTLQNRTEQHYDSHPFDAITPEDEQAPRTIQPKPFIEFCERYLRRKMTVAEIGCGPGRGTMYLAALGIDVTAVDHRRRDDAAAGGRQECRVGLDLFAGHHRDLPARYRRRF